ncbi:copia protein [Tanacetum coccineum]
MQEELLQFKLQDVWVLCDLPDGKRVIGTKWVFRNKRDERGTIIKNKARLVAQGYRQEEGVDYDEVFAPVARIEAIRLFLAFASFMGFTVYQMDVKSAFLYGNITDQLTKDCEDFEGPINQSQWDTNTKPKPTKSPNPFL